MPSVNCAHQAGGWLAPFCGSQQRITDVHNAGTVELVGQLVSTLCMQSVARGRDAIDHSRLKVRCAFLKSTG